MELLVFEGRRVLDLGEEGVEREFVLWYYFREEKLS